MSKKECVLQELYDTLEKLMYPEVAQIRFEEFEEIILTGIKRIDLLHWILQESPGFNSLSLNKLKDNTINDKLFKCYSQIGLCNDENILFGKCLIEKQLQFLTLLISFIKNVHLAEAGSLKNDEHNANNLLKVDDENINKNSYLQTNVHCNSNEINSNDNIESLYLSKHLVNENLLKKCVFNELCSDIKSKITELNNQKTDNFDSTLQKFNASFKVIMSLSTQNLHSNKFSQIYNNLPSDIDNIYSNFTSVNKSIINKSNIINQPIPENVKKIFSPLTEAIKDNLVLIEQACNMFNEN